MSVGGTRARPPPPQHTHHQLRECYTFPAFFWGGSEKKEEASFTLYSARTLSEQCWDYPVVQWKDQEWELYCTFWNHLVLKFAWLNACSICTLWSVKLPSQWPYDKWIAPTLMSYCYSKVKTENWLSVQKHLSSADMCWWLSVCVVENRWVQYWVQYVACMSFWTCDLSFGWFLGFYCAVRSIKITVFLLFNLYDIGVSVHIKHFVIDLIVFYLLKHKVVVDFLWFTIKHLNFNKKAHNI